MATRALRPVSRCCLSFSRRCAQHFHALAQQPTIGFELCFTGTAQSDATAALPFEMGPAAHQPAGDVLELRQLDFQLALVALGALREDVEDEATAIQHALAGELFEIAFLAG